MICDAIVILKMQLTEEVAAQKPGHAIGCATAGLQKRGRADMVMPAFTLMN
jgi:hypothetical protein